MSTAVLEPSFVLGELSPSLFSRFDLARVHVAASTMRNMWPSFRGGAYSRAGTAFVGFSKQTGRSVPPRLISFQFSINQGLALEFGNFYMRVVSNGALVTESPISISALSNSDPGVLIMSSDAYVTGDWVFLSGVGGMTQVNNQTYVLTRISAAHYTLQDIYGNNIDTTGFGHYTAFGTAARIFTLSTIYAEADLDWIKFTESADVMSICCVNQLTGTEYPPQDLSRLSDISWTFTPVVPAPSVLPPAIASISATGTGNTTTYAYVITSVAADGTESVASAELTLGATADIASAAGTVTLTWTTVQTLPLVIDYNIYKATPAYAGAAIANGSLFGYAGSSYGNQFIDSNIVPDFTQVPPFHHNPFARGQIEGLVNIVAGSGYTTIGYTINTSTGSGAVLSLTISGGEFNGYVLEDNGKNYAPTDTITITGNGTGASASLVIGPETGTYPATVSYFQQRRAYGYTINNPDTYFMSQPGAFTNFDSRTPTIDTDAIIGSPWSLQVNGIQFMIPTAGGLLVFTGLSCWLLVGAGSFATNVQALSPSSQLANPQPSVGCSPTLQPIKINYDVIFVGSKNSFYYDLPYQLYALSEPLDLTTNSSHLFTNFTFREHAWCEQPYRLLWSIRNDGVLLSLTYLKTEQVASWARHDTNGTWQSLCSVIEPPVDALYLASQRTIGTNTPYIIERMDNRLWTNVEQAWCVDCGFDLDQPTPNASLTASSPTGLGAVTGATGIVSGQNYSAATFGTVIDAPLTPYGKLGPGTGAVPTLTIAGGQLTGVTFSGGNQGTAYLNPQLVISDPAGSAGGSGGSAVLTLSNNATFTASNGVFAPSNIGAVIRMGGGIAVITGFTDSQHVTANILTPIAQTQPNSNPVSAQIAPSGFWTMTAPVSSVLIPQLSGATVTGLLDGNVLAPTVVPAGGLLVLPQAASQVTIGFGFQAQLQSVYLDTQEGGGTVQAQRKKVAAANVLLEASRGVKMGSNQIDGSTQSPIQVAPVWANLDVVPDQGPKPYNSNTVPLFTGYQRVPVQGGFQKPAQVCLQQDNPLPMNILSLVPEFLEGDTPSQQIPQRQQKAA
jgi:hypothetical protein